MHMQSKEIQIAHTWSICTIFSVLKENCWTTTPKTISTTYPPRKSAQIEALIGNDDLRDRTNLPNPAPVTLRNLLLPNFQFRGVLADERASYHQTKTFILKLIRIRLVDWVDWKGIYESLCEYKYLKFEQKIDEKYFKNQVYTRSSHRQPRNQCLQISLVFNYPSNFLAYCAIKKLRQRICQLNCQFRFTHDNMNS